MKTYLKYSLVSVLSISMLFVFTNMLLAQDDEADSPPSIVAELAFMKSTPGGNYLDVEQKMWKPVHQERINRGELAGWYFYEIRYPVGSATKYNYVTVNVYNDPGKQLKNPGATFEEIVKKVHPDVSMDDFGQKTGASRDMKWMGLYYNIANTWKEDGAPSEYIQCNFFNVEESNGDAYVDMEVNVFQPVHKAVQVAVGDHRDWSLWVKVSPRGSEHGPGYITVDGNGTWEQMNANDEVNQEEMWKKVHPDMPQEKAWEKMSKLRTTARSESWRLVDYVNTPSN